MFDDTLVLVYLHRTTPKVAVNHFKPSQFLLVESEVLLLVRTFVNTCTFPNWIGYIAVLVWLNYCLNPIYNTYIYIYTYYYIYIYTLYIYIYPMCIYIYICVSHICMYIYTIYIYILSVPCLI